MTIADLLTRLASRPGQSQRSLALYMGVSPTAVNEWIQGKRTPDPQYVWKIAELAGMEIEEVMRIAGHLPQRPDSAQPDPDAGIIPEVRAALRKMTAEEQRLAALPAIELAEELLRAGRGKAQE